jgi:hypothetical protein
MSEQVSTPTTTTGTGSPATGQRGNGLAVAGLVCGIVGFLFAWFILGPLAIIFGGVGWNRANHGAKGRGMAIAGVVLGVVQIVLYAVLLAVATNHHFSYHVG